MKKTYLTALFAILLGCLAWIWKQQGDEPQYAPPLPGNTLPAVYPAAMWKKPAQEQTLQLTQKPPLTKAENRHWQNGAQAPPMGDPQARRGGVLRTSNVGPYPANFLAFGSPAPQFFHYNVFECTNLPLVRQHPATGQLLPGLAAAWAEEGRTVHFRLHKQARYSNGAPLRAADFALGTWLRQKAGHDGAWQRINQLIERIDIRGEHELSVTLRQESPLAPLRIAAVLQPAEPRFYAEFGSDYTTRYAQRIPPTTGAYTVGQQQRGRLVRLERVADWWGDKVPAFQHTCNVDAIEYHFLTDEAQAWELLRKGRLNLLQTRHVSGWLQRRNEWAECTNICFTRSELNHPLPPYGIAINTHTLPNPDLRRGIAYALNMQRAIEQVFCGEFESLRSFICGYPWQMHTEPPQTYPFAPEQARLAFAAAGYTHQGQDGILQKADGTRLCLSLLYPPSGRNRTLMHHLAQQARKCGLELHTEAVSWQYTERCLREQSHQLIFWATVPGTPLPDFTRHFAPETPGHDAPFGLQKVDIPPLLAKWQDCRSSAELAAVCHEMNTYIHSQCIWIPGWKENRAFTAHAPGVHFPADERLLHRADVADAHVLWIEE